MTRTIKNSIFFFLWPNRFKLLVFSRSPNKRFYQKALNRLVHKTSLQGFAGDDVWPHSRNHLADLRQTVGPDREGCVGARPCPYFPLDPDNTFVIKCHAAHQEPLIAPYPDGVPWAAQALLGKAVLGMSLFLHHFWNVTDHAINKYLELHFSK